jgi:hypothetical protein
MFVLKPGLSQKSRRMCGEIPFKGQERLFALVLDECEARGFAQRITTGRARGYPSMAKTGK